MTLVIYDSMENYAYELARYLVQQNSDIYTAAFFEKEALASWCRQQRADILLAAAGLMDDSLREIPAGQLVLLTDAACSVPASAEDLPQISRYQSADEILSELLLLGSTAGEERPDAAEGSGAVFTVFYTPVPCPDQTALAWQYVGGRSRERRVLYLCLQEYAGFAERFGRVYRRDFSDLLYLSMHRGGGFEMLLRSVLCEDDGVSYVPPPEQAADLFQVPEREWNTFLRSLRTESGYEEIVFDLGFLFPAAYRILELSSTICLPLHYGGDTADRLRHFLRIYEKRFGSDAMHKLRRLSQNGLSSDTPVRRP